MIGMTYSDSVISVAALLVSYEVGFDVKIDHSGIIAVDFG